MLISESRHKVAMVAELRLDMSSTSRKLPTSRSALLLWQNAKLAKAEARSVFYYGTILLRIIHHLVASWLCWTLAVGCFPSWKKVITFLSSIGIYFSKYLLALMTMIMSAFPYKLYWMSCTLLWFFYTCFQTKNSLKHACIFSQHPVIFG